MERINAFIAFGGNLGQVKETFIHARNDLDATDSINVITSSKIYRTPPVGPAGQPDYLNAVVAIDTTLEPLQLLDQLHLIEERHGRVRDPEPPRWSARTLDLDILTYENVHLDLERLTIPH
ncbi:MAG TPA: 2-amino-4-hydroxy-6-hydroxymethyldihydropteridine diphosphokinase, partial [Mariprofundaceae bacterium]|nr:2-amino-4-hydroxy-6-hydroxymethyldihydropteridine diphosphokinase [Mariprofundaceae bacterium]